MIVVSQPGCVELSLWRVCESSILKWNIEQELEATYWNGAKNLISTTVYSIACKFDALTDMEELHIQKSSDLSNDTLIFRFELHFGYNMEPLYLIWRCNRTSPKPLILYLAVVNKSLYSI